jgi:hypothetical protein
MTDILAMIKEESRSSPVIPNVELSRQIRRSDLQQKNNVYKQLAFVPSYSEISSVGTFMVMVLSANVGSYAGKVLTARTIRRILKAQETIFKYGTLIPRNDAEDQRALEAVRWMSGKQLEWIRLKQATAFETGWTWTSVLQHFPHYKKADIGHLFFIYDYKFSSKHRVHLVFDGSR